MRLNTIVEFATLTAAYDTRAATSACAVPPGSTVEVLGQTSGLGVDATVVRWFVKVRGGPCDGLELIVEDNALEDRRETEPSSTQ